MGLGMAFWNGVQGMLGVLSCLPGQVVFSCCLPFSVSRFTSSEWMMFSLQEHPVNPTFHSSWIRGICVTEGGALHVSTYPTPLGLGVSIGFLAVKLGILEFPATKKKSREKTNTSPKWQFLSKDSSIYNYNSARCFDFQGKPNASFCHIFFGYGLNFLRKKKKNKTWGSGASLQSGWEHISEVGESLPDLLPSKVKFEPSQPSQFT